MKIKDIKFERLRELALEQQELQGNRRNLEVFLINDRNDGNFTWSDTNQGDVFWAFVNDGEYENARDIFNWDKEVFKRGEEVEVSDDKVNWHKAIFVDDVSDICPASSFPIIAYIKYNSGVSVHGYVRKLSPKVKLTKAEIAEKLGIDVESLVITED